MALSRATRDEMYSRVTTAIQTYMASAKPATSINKIVFLSFHYLLEPSSHLVCYLLSVLKQHDWTYKLYSTSTSVTQI